MTGIFQCATAHAAEPSSYKKALESPDKDKWIDAMQEEFQSLEEMGTWKMVDIPKGRKIVGCKWVFKAKIGVDGEVICYKAHLVAKGYTQIYGIDFEETHAPVTRLESIRALLALAAHHDWEVRQIDVKTTYLYGDLDEEIYMAIPEGIEAPPGKCYQLLKALYGLKQAGRQWYLKLKEVLTQFSMRQLPSDPNTFVTHKVIEGVKKTLILPVYVDDLLPHRVHKRVSEARKLYQKPLNKNNYNLSFLLFNLLIRSLNFLPFFTHWIYYAKFI